MITRGVLGFVWFYLIFTVWRLLVDLSLCVDINVLVVLVGCFVFWRVLGLGCRAGHDMKFLMFSLRVVC